MKKLYCSVILDKPPLVNLTKSDLFKIGRSVNSAMIGIMQTHAIKNTGSDKVVSLKPLLNPEDKVGKIQPSSLEDRSGNNKHIVLRYTEEEFNKIDYTIPEEYKDVIFIFYIYEGPMKESDSETMHEIQVKYTEVEEGTLFTLLTENLVITELDEGGEERSLILSMYILPVRNSYTDYLVEKYEEHLNKER